MPDNQAAIMPGVDPPGFDDAVVAEQVRLLIRKRVDLPINVVNATIVAAMLWPFYPAWLLAPWLGLFCAVILARLVIRRRYQVAAPNAEMARRWGRIFTWNSFVTACLWGLTGSVVLVTPDPVYHVFIVFVLGGMMAGGVVSNSAYMPTMLAFMLPSILPVIVVLVSRPDIIQIEMGVMLTLFAVVIIVAGRKINRSIIENFRIRIRGDLLLAKLQASEAAMAEAQRIAHVGSLELDVADSEITCSAEAFRIFGVDAATFKPTLEAMIARIHPEDRVAVGRAFADFVRTGVAHDLDCRMVMDDGAIKYLHTSGQATFDANARPLRLFSTVQDVTGRRQAEAASSLLAAIVDSSDDAIISETVEGTITSWNRGAEHLFGYCAREAIGKNVRMIVPDERRNETVRHLAMLADGRRIDPFDTERQRKDGTRVPVSISVSPTLDGARAVIGESFIARDITERRVAAEALAYRDRLLHAVTIGTGLLVKADSLNHGMADALRALGEALLVDRVIVMQEDAGRLVSGTLPTLRYAWQVPDIQTTVDSSAFVLSPTESVAVAAWHAPLNANKAVATHLATSEGPVHALLDRMNIKSSLMVPIFDGNILWGSLGLDSCRQAREWTASEIDTLKTFGEIVGSLIRHDETRLLLARSESRFRAVTATAQDAIIAIDGAARIRLWNHAAERILGYTVEEAVGKHVHDLLAPRRFRAKADPGMELFRVTGEGGAIGKTTQLAALRKDGTEIVIELSLAASRLDDGWGAIGVLRDVTDRKNAEDKLQFANVLLRSELEAAPHGIIVFGPERKTLLFNRQFTEIWKVSPTSLTGGTLDSALVSCAPLMADPAKFIARMNHLFDHPRESLREEYVMSDGRIINLEIVTLSSASGDYLGRVGYFRDITERRKADDRLAFANLLLQTQMEASLDGILVVNENKEVVAFNQRFAKMWKIPPADLAAGGDVAVLAKVTSSVKDAANFLTRVRYLYEHPGEDSQDEYETTDGRSIDRYTVTLYSPSRIYLGRAWFFRDITERKRVEALALRMARYDVLTGLANRAVFVEALQHAIASAKRGEKGFAVLYLDLDHFKDVNDTLGHPVGDELLKAVAGRLRASLRETDTIARFGGDEFAIILADIRDPADAALLADQLITGFTIPFTVQGSDIHSGASIGIATYGSEATDAEMLLSHADVALYRAKSEGRGGYRFFTDVMDTEVQMRVTLGAELRVAIDEGQLFLMYQPQVAIDTGRLTGVEALVRWRHPRRGVLGPALFIPIAEQIGIVGKLGHWVLWEACRQGKAWLDAGIAPSRISVNVSALQFRTSVGLESDVAAALARTGMPSRMLELELTESVLMDATREHSDLLLRLRTTGVTIAIDDFGTGFSSLGYLRRFPSNRIKIAQRFVTNLETTPGDAAIIRATIGLARELNIAVIAEGVETQVQLDLLRGWGCGEVQGFLFARPLTVEDAEAVLRAGKIVPSKGRTVEVLDAAGRD